MAGVKELKDIVRKIVLEVFPELQGYQYPIKAKVVKVHESGGKVNEFDNLYSCDVQPLKKDGSVDEESPVIPDVEIPVVWAGDQRGVFCLPKKGTVCRIGFYYNDPAHPYLDAVLPQGYEIPDHAIDSIIIQHSEGIKIEITPKGEILVKTSEKMTAEIEKLLEVIIPNFTLEANSNGELKVNASKEVTLTSPLVQAIADKIILGAETHPVAYADVVKAIYDSHKHPYGWTDGGGSGQTGTPIPVMTGHDSKVSFTK
ncbi:hypothetical protein JCM16358_23230 [Halanaerocella petrolearia]